MRKPTKGQIQMMSQLIRHKIFGQKFHEKYAQYSTIILMILMIVFAVKGDWLLFAVFAATSHIQYRFNELYWNYKNIEYNYSNLVEEVRADQDVGAGI